MARSVFRDSMTGHFVSRETYNRSQAQGGERYYKDVVYEREERGETQQEREEREERERIEEMDLEDFINEFGDEDVEEIHGSFDYKRKG